MRLQETSAKRLGFTLVELLIVIGIGVIITASAMPIYSNFQSGTQVNESATQLLQTVRLAKMRSEQRVNNSAHGVRFFQTQNQDSYVLYQGASYVTRDAAYDRRVVLDNVLNLTSSGGLDISFQPGSGVPSASSMITITHSVHGSQTIQIHENGLIELVQ